MDYVKSTEKRLKMQGFLANPGMLYYLFYFIGISSCKEGLIDTDTLIIDAKSGTSGSGKGS